MTLRLPLTAAFFAALIAAQPAFATDGSNPEPPGPVETWQADPATRFDGTEFDLGAFKWIARPIVVFADSPADPRFREQMELLAARPGALIERDVVIVTDTDPAAASELRRILRPRGFMLALIGKDGTVKLRKPFPWSVRELTRSIDKMPLRKQEIRSRTLIVE